MNTRKNETTRIKMVLSHVNRWGFASKQDFNESRNIPFIHITSLFLREIHVIYNLYASFNKLPRPKGALF